MQGTLRLDSAKFQAATVLSASLEIDNNSSNNVNDPMIFIASTWCAAMKNRLRGDLIRGKLRLLVSATLIKTRHNDENDSGCEHENREEREVLVVRQLACAVGVQDPFVE
jgi:hypothetical protein